MRKFELNIDAEPKDNYEKAKKLLLETDKAIQLLSPYEQQKLAYEFMQYKAIYGLSKMI